MKAAAFEKQMMTRLAAMHQEGKELNLKGTNDKLANIVLQSLPNIASLCLPLHNCTSNSYGKHDLVADLFCTPHPYNEGTGLPLQDHPQYHHQARNPKGGL